MRRYSGYSVYWSAIIWCTSTGLIFSEKMSDSKENTPNIEEPVAASKEEEHPARAAIAEHRADVISRLANGPLVTPNHRASVIQHLVDGNIDAAFRTLMTDPNGHPLDYAESRSRYG